MFSDAKMPSLMDFQVLRVLDLHDCSNLHDGDIGDIGNLVHLRYLSLHSRSISKIPRQISRLQHLEILDLGGTGLREFPGTVVHLHQLVRLFLPPGVQLPVGIGTMVALEELSTLDVARNSKEVVLELGSLTKLKVLAIHCYATSAISEGIKNSLTSSLCKLGERNLRSVKLWTGTSGPSMDFLIDSWCPLHFISKYLTVLDSTISLAFQSGHPPSVNSPA